jgi:hypothetical protein
MTTKFEDCTQCGRSATNLTACEGQRLCHDCVTTYLTGKSQDFNAAYYGEQYRFATGTDLPVTPRKGDAYSNYRRGRGADGDDPTELTAQEA